MFVSFLCSNTVDIIQERNMKKENRRVETLEEEAAATATLPLALDFLHLIFGKAFDVNVTCSTCMYSAYSICSTTPKTNVFFLFLFFFAHVPARMHALTHVLIHTHISFSLVCTALH